MNHDEIDRALENEIMQGSSLLEQNIEALMDLKHLLRKFKLYRNSKKFNTTKFEDYDRSAHYQLFFFFHFSYFPISKLIISIPEMLCSDNDQEEDEEEGGGGHKNYVKKLLQRQGKKGQGKVHGATYRPDILSYCASIDDKLDIGTDAPMISVDYKPISTILMQVNALKQKPTHTDDDDDDE